LTALYFNSLILAQRGGCDKWREIYLQKALQNATNGKGWEQVWEKQMATLLRRASEPQWHPRQIRHSNSVVLHKLYGIYEKNENKV
jgi:hypothetical protein